MKVHLATLGNHDWETEYLSQWQGLARQNRYRRHTLCEDAPRSDLIVFVNFHQNHHDVWMRDFARHPLVRAWGEKVFVYDERDITWPHAAGLYVSATRREFDARTQCSGPYALLTNAPNAPSPQTPDLLFSFLGARTHPARDAILTLRHPRAVVEDTSDFRPFDAALKPSEIARRRSWYREVSGRSKFVLCPRGAGTSSFRLFETLALGRVPVILSDEWVEPPGPLWNACTLRVPEKDAARLPQLLSEAEARYETMARAARETWRAFYAPDARFHTLCQSLAALQCALSASYNARSRLTPGALSASRTFRRHLARYLKSRVLR